MPLAPDPCGPGYDCEEVNIDPCGEAGEGGDACAACGQPAHLCLPVAGCEVSFDVTLDGEKWVSISADGAVELKLALHNRTDVPVTLTYLAPCHGPMLTGLPDGYDV